MTIFANPPAASARAKVVTGSDPFLIAAAWLVSGAALWLTRASLDVVGDPLKTTRVALLPSGPELLGLLTLMLVIGAGVRAAVNRWLPGRRDGFLQMSLPLLFLTAVALPYLPWLADLIGILRGLSRPLAILVWVVVLGQVVLIAGALRSSEPEAPAPTHRRGRGEFLFASGNSALSGLKKHAGVIGIFLATATVSGTAAFTLQDSELFPGGDEPHYLVMMQSLWRDRDLKIENNHTRRDYAEYYGGELRPDYRVRGRDGDIYSIHPIGLPMLGAPVYAVGGYRGVVFLMIALTALSATLMWRWAAVFTSSREAATFAWAAVFAGAPMLFNSIAVIPEIPAAFCVMVALAWRPEAKRGSDLIFSPEAGELSEKRGSDPFFVLAVRGAALGALPWLSTKYAPMAVALAAVLALRILRGLTPVRGTRGSDLSSRRALIALLLPLAASLCAWFAFFYWIWGHPSPTVPYGSDSQMAVRNVLAGPLGLLIDQEYGVIAFAPALAIALSAIAQMTLGRSDPPSPDAGDRFQRAGGSALHLAETAGVKCYENAPVARSAADVPTGTSAVDLAPASAAQSKAEPLPRRRTGPQYVEGLTGPMDAEGSARRHALEITVVFIALLGTVGAFDLWWGGSAPPGRPLVSALPLLGLPIAWLYERSAIRPVQRAAYQLLLLTGIGIALAMMLAQDGLLIPQDRDGSSRLLQWLSPLWPIWGIMPSFAAARLREALTLTAIWIGAAIVLAWFFKRSRLTGPGAAALMATAGFFLMLLCLSAVAPAVVRGPAWAQFDPATRSRVALLDEFDAVARPIAVVYNPFTIVEASSVPPLIFLSASPGSRTDRQPLPVFLNARFGLPAGDYQVEIGGAPQDVSGSVGLQIGRTGPPVREWQAVVTPGEHWQAAFPLPLDAEFVGFRNSPSLQAVRSLLLRPIRIVDVTKRLPLLPVLSGATFGSTLVFFHDERAYPESTGFWVRGRASTLITLAPDRPVQSLTLRLRSGPRPNSVTLEMGAWAHRVELPADMWGEAVLPVGDRFGPLRLRLITAEGFIPAEVLPGSSDQRLLGCWVEIVS